MSLLSRLAVQAARAYGILSSADKTKVVADYLVVAGGGGGGGSQGGGGGAGGLLTSTFTLSTLNTYSIAVGAGGNGGANVNGTSGSNSSVSGTGLSTVTSTGGGRGGGEANAGASGGSGGGGGAQGGSGAGGSPTSGQGFAGGSGSNPNAGGGGGAGEAGNTDGQRHGGDGVASSISGSSVTYAGGGSGGSNNGSSVTGGDGGGGTGTGNTTAGTAGTVNTGGGGGGGGSTSGVGNGAGGAGGSGIVIISYTSATPKFVGGTLTTSGGKQIHTFTSSGTLSPIGTSLTANYLVVAGGGGAGDDLGGAGGAGGFRTSAGTSGGGGSAESSLTLYSGALYVVTVGAGGAGATSGGATGTNGGDSSIAGTAITTVTSLGGGGGAGDGGGSGVGTPNSGGSGGGAASGSGRSGAAGTANQGYAGGSNPAGTYYGASAGGGGAGAAGTGRSGSSATGGNGGNGVQSSISGTATYYAGGGSGGTGTGGTAGTAGLGGGGQGKTYAGSTLKGGNGQANTGGGGGGGTSAGGDGGDGGSGIVIISYAGSQVFNGGVITSSGGNTIHTFTSTGALTPLTNNLNNSLRFRSSASTYLNRTATVTGNRQTFTWSSWVKRGALGARQHLFVSANPVVNTVGQQEFQIAFASADHLEISGGTSGVGNDLSINTTQLFRDPSAWYHIVVAVDTTQATSANRVKLYINGNQVTAFQGGITYPSQNYNTSVNLTGFSHRIGGSGTAYLDAYLTDTIEVDGQALEPYYFGNNDANGVWKPILYKGTYGTNGFYLTFGNTTSTTTLGYDSSPNGNNWTTNNISLTAGTTYDAMTDVPTNTSATVANYPTINPLSLDTSASSSPFSYQDANLRGNSTSGGTVNRGFTATMAIPSNATGKYYFEVQPSFVYNFQAVGLTSTPTYLRVDNSNTGCYAYSSQAQKYMGSSTAVSYGGSWSANDIIGVAYDASTRDLTFYKNGVSQGSAGTLAAGVDYFPMFYVTNNATTWNIYVNFGQRPFAYTPPTGFVALNTYNLPTPTILQGNKYMDATLYTGNGSTQVIVNQAQFKPDLVWNKGRSNAVDNCLTDSNRGANKQLVSNTTGAELTYTNQVTGFNSNGFSLGADNLGYSNYSGVTYVGWQWQAGQGSTSSNTSGSITSTVSVNTTAGFSVVTYTGTGANATVGHGLGVAPKMVIVKNRTTAGDEWCVWHTSLTNATYYLYLNGTAAQAVDTTFWNSTAPSSTVISLGSNGRTNRSSSSMVCYAWAEIAGFSKFGSYTGNGSADGPMVYCNFAPKFILIKRTDTSGTSWVMYDSARSTYNVVDKLLLADSSGAEVTATSLDFLSNGFKLRSTDGSRNASGGTYIYAAFASNPFRNSNAY